MRPLRLLCGVAAIVMALLLGLLVGRATLRIRPRHPFLRRSPQPAERRLLCADDTENAVLLSGERPSGGGRHRAIPTTAVPPLY